MKYVDLSAHSLNKIMKSRMIDALKASAKGEIKKHLVNIDVYLHNPVGIGEHSNICLLYTSPSPRDNLPSRMPSSA